MVNKYQKQSDEAQERMRRRKACTSKRAFTTAEEARQKGQLIYHCRFCGKWHRATMPNRVHLKFNTPKKKRRKS